MDIVVSLLYLLLYIAAVCLCAALIVWLMRQMGIAVDPQTYRIAQIVLALIVLILVVSWVAGILPLAHWHRVALA
jgi:lysylphosphatidylglycerol synthetase-like protein (DUF2156 family)